MLRTMRRASALAAIPAALALVLGGTASASTAGKSAAPDTGTVIGTGYPLPNYLRTPHPLKDVGSTCTRVKDTRSAKNAAGSGRVITLYLYPRCTEPVAVIQPGQNWPWVAEVGAMSYTTGPA
jgi:hypothetical protein